MTIDEYDSPSYEGLLATAFPQHTLWSEMFGSYQGDIIITLEGEENFGVAIVGYGSCSGCDWLEGELGWDPTPEKIAEFTAELVNLVMWFDSKRDFCDWVKRTDDGERIGEWYFYEEGMREWLTNFCAEFGEKE